MNYEEVSIEIIEIDNTDVITGNSVEGPDEEI